MQNRRAFLFFGLAVLLGIAAAFAAQRLIESQTPVRVDETLAVRDVVVARVDVPVGTALATNQLTTVEWPEKYAPQDGFASPSDLNGRVLRRAVSAGEPVLDPMLLPAGALAGLAPVIAAEKRAISVKVDQVIGVAGFVRPGARVDVLATLERTDFDDNPYSKVFLQDIPVLAIDQQMEKADNGKPELVNVVTLEVNPEQAEKLIFSAHEGRLQLALRNPGDSVVVETQSAGVADVFGRRKKARRPGASRAVTTVEVLRGADRSVNSF
ncbi:MAG TPA: Flp pilus assembly protein CpaB [Phycisphaerae bacterium]|nr:Flp pilus assembly protein CpaB [Phycisphaerae bacterium]